MNQDPITLQRIQTLHPAIRKEVTEIYAQICVALQGRALCRFTQTYRSIAEQDALYALGRTRKGKIVTQARGGFSYHNYGLAIDIVLLVNNGTGKTPELSYNTQVDFDGDGRADWQEVTAIFKQHGYEWGGDWHFRDLPHFQKTFGNSIAQLRKKVQQGYTHSGGKMYPVL